MKIIVPATSANLGPGFDSVGVALSKYLTVDILEPSDRWLVEHNLGSAIPTDEDNLLLQTALSLKVDLPKHRLKMTSDIPLARGLGSSSSVIVAGIELANYLGQLGLTEQEKLEIATKIEGHPDNVAPALFGNLVIASSLNGHLYKVVRPFPDAAFVAFIPNYELKTADSRGVLPTELPYKEAVQASSIANLAIAGLLAGDLPLAGRAIEGDLFHEPYRQNLVKEFTTIREIAHTYGAYATYLSGAGPTVMVLTSQENKEAIQAAIDAKGFDGTTCLLQVDTKGVQLR